MMLRRSTLADCGICESSTASSACLVPGTDASMRDRGCVTGIRLKSSGRFGVANVHGPEKSGAENQRPATRKDTRPFSLCRKTSSSVLLTHKRVVPITGTYFGAPSVSSSSAGILLMYTVGTRLAETPPVGNDDLTSDQFPSSGRLRKLAGTAVACRH